MAESIKCIKDVGKGKKVTFRKGLSYSVFISTDGDGSKTFWTRDTKNNKKILFSTKKPKIGIKLLQEHFDLTEAPELRQTAGL